MDFNYTDLQVLGSLNWLEIEYFLFQNLFVCANIYEFAQCLRYSKGRSLGYVIIHKTTPFNFKWGSSKVVNESQVYVLTLAYTLWELKFLAQFTTLGSSNLYNFLRNKFPSVWHGKKQFFSCSQWFSGSSTKNSCYVHDYFEKNDVKIGGFWA